MTEEAMTPEQIYQVEVEVQQIKARAIEQRIDEAHQYNHGGYLVEEKEI